MLVASTSGTSQCSQIDLPETLLNLEIRSTEVNWKVPFLQKLTLKNCEGRVKVPLSVSQLTVYHRDGKRLEGLEVSQELDECDIV